MQSNTVLQDDNTGALVFSGNFISISKMLYGRRFNLRAVHKSAAMTVLSIIPPLIAAAIETNDVAVLVSANSILQCITIQCTMISA